MSGDAGFWRNVGIIGLAHVVVLSALVHWKSAPPEKPAANILWMDGGTAGAAMLASNTIPPPTELSTPPPIVIPEPTEPEPAPEMAAPDIELPAPTPKSTPIPTPNERPKATATPAPKPAVKPSPKPTAKPSPKSTPKATPKKVLLVKASATPKPSATPTPKPDTEPAAKSDPPVPPDIAAAIAEAASAGAQPKVGITGTGTGGSGGRGIGAGGASQFGWYAHMLHDRFFSQWAQPTSVVRSGAKMSTLVKLRIEKDGRVSRFTILRPSGNVVVDESVSAVGKRVTQVEPLPSGLGTDHYDVNINFELNSD